MFALSQFILILQKRHYNKFAQNLLVKLKGSEKSKITFIVEQCNI